MCLGLGPSPNPILHQQITNVSLKVLFKLIVLSTTIGGLVARPLANLSAQTEGHGFNSHRVHNFYQYNQPMMGCHVAAQYWATWHHTIHPNI
jgi:hypothetical protein